MTNNKILTVSYGTFSCTLEGFDDSFGTMKAIAEYFRDLAADDRYFGAEPPVPDAEMLARIAEREISRRVEAREHQGQIVLSAAQTEAQVETPEPAAKASEPTPEPRVSVALVPDVDAAATPEAKTEEVSVADIAAVVEESSEETATEEHIEDVPEVTDDAPEAEMADDTGSEHEMAEPSDDTPEVEMVEDTVAPDEMPEVAEAAPVLPDAEVEDEAEAFFAESESTGDSFEDEAEDMAEAEAPDEDAAEPGPESIAAKLQRIRAVVSQSQEEAAEDEMFEDEHAEDLAPTSELDDLMAQNASVDTDEDETPEDVMAHAAEDIAHALNQDDAAEIAADDHEDADDDVAGILSRFEQDTAMHVPEDIAFQDGDDGPVEDAAEAVDVQTGEDIGDDSIAALLDSDVDTDENDENLFDEAEAAFAEDSAQDEDAEDDDAPRRARVIKVKRADIDAALASGQLEAVDEDDAETEHASSLSDEEEAELMADLAEVEAELPTADDEDDTDFEEAAAVADDDVNRLMAEADNQMEEPEGSRRRSAFAHLKAAVMAKKADAGIGKEGSEDEGAFRSDLASVVVPRRPAARGERGERPEAPRPAPLKLVAEQRVDIDTADAAPVRPRRVAAPDDAPEAETQDGSFADYAAEMGAHNLPDLLEAAASYLSFVEGRDQFSRPQLMTKVRQVEADNFSREDGMRSLGQLLRAGKIEKRKGGRFVVTDDIGYRPDHRAAG
ncbi:MAG: hypothetical protein AAFP16_15555 [Pseudomonadota bacterium]